MKGAILGITQTDVIDHKVIPLHFAARNYRRHAPDKLIQSATASKASSTITAGPAYISGRARFLDLQRSTQ